MFVHIAHRGDRTTIRAQAIRPGEKHSQQFLSISMSRPGPMSDEEVLVDAAIAILQHFDKLNPKDYEL
jgi:hypothetical protein